jgi:hypothetical protein
MSTTQLGMMKPFRQGQIYDSLLGGKWLSVEELAKLTGATQCATNHCLARMFEGGVVEKIGRKLQERKFGLKTGAQRPVDKRGAPTGHTRLKRERNDGTLSWTYTRIELEILWPPRLDNGHIYSEKGMLDTRVPKVPAESEQAAD